MQRFVSYHYLVALFFLNLACSARLACVSVFLVSLIASSRMIFFSPPAGLDIATIRSVRFLFPLYVLSDARFNQLKHTTNGTKKGLVAGGRQSRDKSQPLRPGHYDNYITTAGAPFRRSPDTRMV